MVDFSSIRNIFTGSTAAPAPAPAPTPAPAPAKAIAPAEKGDSFSVGGSDGGSAFRNFTDPGTAAGKWLGERVPDAWKAKGQELNGKVEQLKKDAETMPGHETGEKMMEKILDVSGKADHWLKDNVPIYKRALEPKVIDLGDV